MKLTKRIVDKAEIKNKNYVIWDDDVKGFGLRVYTSGIKSYMIQYRASGRTRKLTLGKHGILTPDEARKLARENLVDVAKGGNPTEDKKLYSEAPRFSVLCDRFLDEHAALNCKPSTVKEYTRCVNIFINPSLGSFKAQDITRQDVAKLHHTNMHIQYQANRILGVLSKIFNLAEEWGLRPDGSNPTRHVKKYQEKKRERYLEPDELRKLWEVMEKRLSEKLENSHMIAAFKMLLLTGCRLGEIQTLKWEYVRGNALILPDSKTGAKKVYLGMPTLEVLSSLARIENNPYVFVGKKEGGYITDFQKPWRRIRKDAKIEDVRIHDLRHTFASYAVSGGETLHITGKLLGHSQVQTTSRYAHLADAPMHEAADRVADAITNVIQNKGKVD
ncbi:MAG: tyrosine-type recombinase/integrase [Emcibacteraceae bacterium]|nr:tyrosine-type recombinase/integrase [Emcibacteraceae bacterium]